MPNKNGRVPTEPGSRASTEPQSAQGLGPPGFDPSRVWHYARSQKKSLHALLPKDFTMMIEGDVSTPSIRVMGAMTTTLECDALIATLLHFRRFLTSHREAVAGDFCDPPPGPSFSEEFAAMFGSFSDSDGSPEGGDKGTLGSVHDSAGRRHRHD